MGAEGGSWVEMDGRGEGGGGEGGWIWGGGGSEVRRRLRGGGLTSGDGIVPSGQAGWRSCDCKAEVLCTRQIRNERRGLSPQIFLWIVSTPPNRFGLMPLEFLHQGCVQRPTPKNTTLLCSLPDSICYLSFPRSPF